MWSTMKAFFCKLTSCCRGESEEEQPRLVIGEPYDFRHVTLSENDQAMIREYTQGANTMQIQSDGATPTSAIPTARLDRARAHTRALSNSFKSATTTAMASVSAKNAGYSTLANGSSSTMQPLRPDHDAGPHEMKELLPYNADGTDTRSLTGTNSVETAMAGCEEDDKADRAFIRTK